MGGDAAWLRFDRRGGTPPRDDEALRVDADGAFTARRTLGGRRIGQFAGRLRARTLRRLRVAAEGIAAAGDVRLPTPRGGATEVLAVAGRSLEAGSNETPGKPWRALLDVVRGILEDEAIEHPLAAIGLHADTRAARLSHLGDVPVDVDTGSILVRVVRLSDEGAVLARWSGRHRAEVDEDDESLAARSAWTTASPGWREELPFDHPIELAAGDYLQVWVSATIRDGAGERAGRLYMPVLDHD